MPDPNEILSRVRATAKTRLLFLPHALRQMSRPERMISVEDVRAVVASGEIIEDYPEDARGHSVLMCGRGTDLRVLHVVCSPKDEYLAVITAYVPSETEWEADLKTRKRK
jgi:hypothetical protein